MHANIATPGLAANHLTGNGRNRRRIVERSDMHIIFPSWYSSEYSLSHVIQHVNYTQVQNFDTEFNRSEFRVFLLLDLAA